MFDPGTFVGSVEVTSANGDAVNILLTGGVAAAFVYGRQVCELITKLIPDSKRGWLGVVRNITAVIAGYRKNNVD